MTDKQNTNNPYASISVERHVVTKSNEIVYLEKIMSSIAVGKHQNGDSYIKDVTDISNRDLQVIFGQVNSIGAL